MQSKCKKDNSQFKPKDKLSKGRSKDRNARVQKGKEEAAKIEVEVCEAIYTKPTDGINIKSKKKKKK